VINARNAMTGGGKLTIRTGNMTLDEGYCKSVSCARPSKFIYLSVTDTGAGMDKELIEHIFEPFTYNKKAGGDSGLGLSVVHGIVKQHKGWINVHSMPRQGSTFTVYLPAFYVEAEDETEEVISSGRLQNGVQRILVMED
ncbi:ATP-binding protein, partial [Chloroflexota bacterium]